MQTGSLSDWIHVFLSAVAVYCAITASRQAERLYRENKERERQQEGLRLRREAAKLSVWFAAECGKTYKWGLVLNNVSERPFYRLHIEGKYCDEENAKEEPFVYQSVKVVPTGKFFIQRADPSNRFPFDLPKVYDENNLEPLLVTNKHIITLIRFTDSDGVSWQIDAEGNLLPENPG